MVLDAYEDALTSYTGKNPRLRIEHAQIVDQKDHERFSQLNIIASMQPIHCTSDMAWVEERLGKERLNARAYPWRSLLNHHVMLAFGSDTPVESPNPLLGLYAAVTRSLPESDIAFMPEERLSLKEALAGYMQNAAYAEFAEDKKGIIKEGYLADFIAVNNDILHSRKTAFTNAHVVLTVVNGDIVYQDHNLSL
jgi:predicted amidohydrolase YtcJ